MDKLGGTCIVHLSHHADMGVNSKFFHTSPTGHTSEDPQGAAGDHSVVGTHLRRQRRKCLRRWCRKMRGGTFCGSALHLLDPIRLVWEPFEITPIFS